MVVRSLKPTFWSNYGRRKVQSDSKLLLGDFILPMLMLLEIGKSLYSSDNQGRADFSVWFWALYGKSATRNWMKTVRFSREPIVIFGGLYILLLEIKMCLDFYPSVWCGYICGGRQPGGVASLIPAVAASHFTCSSISPLAPFPLYVYSFNLFSFPVSYCTMLQLSLMTLCLF